MKLLKVAVVIEVVGIAFLGAGIGIEIGYEADIGFILATTGSAAIAGGSLIWAKIFKMIGVNRR